MKRTTKLSMVLVLALMMIGPLIDGRCIAGRGPG